jgi:hypothetical protein
LQNGSVSWYLSIGSEIQWKDIAASAQTKRRSGAGPVRNFLDGQGLTGRFSFRRQSDASFGFRF